MKLPSDDEFEQGMSPVTSRIDEHKWEVASQTTRGAAGLSVAMLFIVAQVGVATPALWFSLLCSVFAIPVWLVLWQFGEAYSFYGVRPEAKLSLKSGLITGALLYVTGGVLLVLAFFAFIWHFSVVAAFAFLLASAGGVVLTVRHHTAVRNQAEASNGNGV
jgi:hypothetical protein